MEPQGEKERLVGRSARLGSFGDRHGYFRCVGVDVVGWMKGGLTMGKAKAGKGKGKGKVAVGAAGRNVATSVSDLRYELANKIEECRLFESAYGKEVAANGNLRTALKECQRDWAFTVAQNDQLSKERTTLWNDVERLKGEATGWHEEADRLFARVNDLTAENKRLKVMVERGFSGSEPVTACGKARVVPRDALCNGCRWLFFNGNNHTEWVCQARPQMCNRCKSDPACSLWEAAT